MYQTNNYHSKNWWRCDKSISRNLRKGSEVCWGMVTHVCWHVCWCCSHRRCNQVSSLPVRHISRRKRNSCQFLSIRPSRYLNSLWCVSSIPFNLTIAQCEQLNFALTSCIKLILLNVEQSSPKLDKKLTVQIFTILQYLTMNTKQVIFFIFL